MQRAMRIRPKLLARRLRPFPALHSGLRHQSSLPPVLQTSFWLSLIPKPLRRNRDADGNIVPKKKAKSKDWNPATFYIIIFLLIGSMSIHSLTLQREFDAFTRRADVRIGLLREVVERIQRGEVVDVEKTLGTDEEDMEAQWEDLLRDIEKGDMPKNSKKRESSSNNEASTTKGTTAEHSTVVQTRAQKAVKLSDFF